MQSIAASSSSALTCWTAKRHWVAFVSTASGWVRAMLACCLVHVLMMSCRHAVFAEPLPASLAALRQPLQTPAPWLLLSQRGPWALVLVLVLPPSWHESASLG